MCAAALLWDVRSHTHMSIYAAVLLHKASVPTEAEQKQFLLTQPKLQDDEVHRDTNEVSALIWIRTRTPNCKKMYFKD